MIQLGSRDAKKTFPIALMAFEWFIIGFLCVFALLQLCGKFVRPFKPLLTNTENRVQGRFVGRRVFESPHY
jgi:hypothetical protein